MPGLTLGALILTALTCIFLWRFAFLRPYIIAGGAGLAAFLGPLPGILSPETRGRWLLTVVIASAITFGTWFAVKGTDDSLRASEADRTELTDRLNSLGGSLGAVVSSLPDRGQSAAYLRTGRLYKALFNDHHYKEIVDLGNDILAIDPENGHALYYRGEAYRMLGDTTQMRGSFLNFISFADHHPEALDGDASVCYARPEGYCAERLGWIEHLMALDFLNLAATKGGNHRVVALRRSLRYESDDIHLRKVGFDENGRTPSSCDVVDKIEEQLSSLHKETRNVVSDLQYLKQHCAALS